MELGGSDAFVVLEDADLDLTVKWAVWAKMNNSGQCCVAGKRFIVVDSLADRFLEKFRAAPGALKPGDPMDPATTRAPWRHRLLQVARDYQMVETTDASVLVASLVTSGRR